MLLSSFAEVSSGGKGQSKKVFMCFGSLKMERSTQIWEAESWGRKETIFKCPRFVTWKEEKMEIWQPLELRKLRNEQC